MKLLIITQKVDENDDNLSFFHSWIEEFARQTEEVLVIAQFVGAYHLPKNVEVFSLGKEKGYSKIRQLFNFYKLLFQKLPKIDSVFVHMIPMWVVLGCPIFKFFRKNVYLWYMHKTVNFMLKLAGKFVVRIFTASPESCRLKSGKIVVTGHGIDTEFIKPPVQRTRNREFQIISVGRIAPVKNCALFIDAAEIMIKRGFKDFLIRIAGVAILKEDQIYFERLKNSITEKRLEDKVIFVGSVPYKNLANFYQSGDLFINFSDTGSLDKAILGAMATNLLVLTSNEAFKDILQEKYFTSKNPQEIAGKIMALSGMSTNPALRNYVAEKHSLGNTIKFILSNIQ